MNTILLGALLAASAPPSVNDLVFEGTWNTTNRRLDGTMSCVVTDLGDNQWKGHFYGTWQGTPFSYQVKFSGPPDKLRGQAVIDGADYEWTGELTPSSFKGKFWGSRYLGSFSLKQKRQL